MALITEDLIEGRIDKVAIAIDRIKAFEPAEGFYLAYSGGKDSSVILSLTQRAGVKFTAWYNLTTVDAPELVRFIMKNPIINISRPPKTMWRLIEENGPPLRNKRFCCRLLKEGNGDGTIITGIRWAESTRRSKRKMVEACYNDSRRHYLNPIIDWSESDVWQYIHENNVPHCSLYDEGFKRLGCVGCPMARSKGMLAEFARWPKLKDAYIRAFDKYIQRRISRGKEAIQLTGQEMFDWWVAEAGKKIDPDQTVMFE